MSVNVGQTESFKITTPSSNYHIDILRLGYYGGDGARMIQAGIKPTAKLPQTQPSCLVQSGTGLIDCGNWGVSASWTVPSTAVSGLYIAHLVRDDAQDPGGDSQILFVVRNDASHSDVLVQTSDETWEAYNNYGGNSLYTCTVSCPPGNPLAYKGADAVSYNRPFDGDLSTDNGDSDPYYAEYQMIRFLERNGYDLSYTSGADVDNNGALLKNHKIFISSGHDEYWSSGQRSNVQSALAAGVNLAFFSGNEIFWKTRWGPSIDGSNTAYRTLITYKETHYNAAVDPQDPPTWTGAWADPRFSPPADGGLPANALTGQQFVVNSGSTSLQRARDLRQAEVLAQHGRGQAHVRQPDRELAPGPVDRGLRMGYRSGQRIQTSGRVRHVLHDAQRRAGVHGLRQPDQRQRDRDPPHLAVSRVPAAPSCSPRGPFSGRGALTSPMPGVGRGRIRTIRLTRTCSRRRSTCSPTWARSPAR